MTQGAIQSPPSPTTMSVQKNIELVQERIGQACRRAGRSADEITLIAVSKTMPPARIEEAFAAGIRHFGENRVQEAREKMGKLGALEPRPTWHLVGSLQANKVNAALGLFDVIQSVDSVHLAEAISRRLSKPFPVLLEVNAAAEPTKRGFRLHEVPEALERLAGLANLNIQGLMTVAPAGAGPEALRDVFRTMRRLRDRHGLAHLSMGMTEDFEIAIEEGSTMVRIGRAVFGERRS